MAAQPNDHDELEDELKELRALKIKEVSAVDHGANLLSGWAVIKSESAEVLAQHERLKAAVKLAEEEGMLDGAPENVLSAVQTLKDYLQGIDQAVQVASEVAKRANEPSTPERSRAAIFKDLEALGKAHITKTRDSRRIENVIADLLKDDPIARELWREHEQS